MMLMVVLLAFGMSACTANEDNSVIYNGPEESDGDNPDDREAELFTVNGTTFSVNYASFKAEVLNANDTFYCLQFANGATFGSVDPFDVVSIVYSVTNGSQTELATGEFTNFEVSVTRLSADESQDCIYYAFASDTPGAKLKVTKSGNGYQIDFDAMKYTIDSTTSTTTYDGTAFSFTGTVNKGLIVQ